MSRPSIIWGKLRVASIAVFVLATAFQLAPAQENVYPSVGFPKAFIDDKYISENSLQEAGLNPLSGSTVTLVSLGDGKTNVIGVAGQMVTVEKEIPGHFSEYEASLSAGGLPAEIAKANSVEYNVPKLDAIGVQPFTLRSEIVWDTGPGGMHDIAYKGEKAAIFVSEDDKWQKKLLSNGMALFIIKMNFTSRKYLGIKDFPLNCSLRSANGQLYPALEPDAGFLSKIRSKLSGKDNKTPQECDHAISKITLKPFGKSSGIVCVIAPADDFSLATYFGGPIYETGYKDDFKPGPKWKDQFPFHSQADFEEKLIAKYLLRANSSLTKSGYNTNLSIASYLYYKTENSAASLAIVEKLLSDGYSSGDIPLKLLKVLNLIKLKQLGSAVNLLQSADTAGTSEIYRKYLLSSCLRELEVLAAVEKASVAGELLGEVSASFLRKTELTPDVDESLILRITTKAEVSDERQFHDALEYYRNSDFPKAILILEHLASKNFKGSSLGPAVLDALGGAYLQIQEPQKAIAAFKRMEDDYPTEEFVGPSDGEGYYAGPGRAIGLKNQLYVYAAPGYRAGWEYLIPDCQKVIEVSKKLITQYPGVIAKCYEGCGTYSDRAIAMTKECLMRGKTPTKEIEEKIGELLRLVTKEDGLIVRTKTFLAKRYQSENNYEAAIRLFREVVNKYPESHLIDEMDGVVEFYGLDALAAIIDMRRSQGARAAEIEKIQKEFEKLYIHFGDIGGKNMQNFMPKMLKAKYLRYLPAK